MNPLSISLLILDIFIILGLAILVIGPNRTWHNLKKVFRLQSK